MITTPAGAGIVFSRTAITNQWIEPTAVEDPQGIWRNRLSLTIRTDSAGATLYLQDPASGAVGLPLAASTATTLGYVGPLWITTTGTVHIVALG